MTATLVRPIAEGMPIEIPGCGGKSLMLLGSVGLLVWWWLR